MINGMHIYYEKKTEGKSLKAISEQKASGLKPISKKASGLKPIRGASCQKVHGKGLVILQ